MAQQCMASRVHRTYGIAMYGTNSAPYRWHKNVCYQHFTIEMGQQCMAPKVQGTNGTAVYGTKSTLYRWYNTEWHQQRTVHLAQCMTPTMHCTDGTTVYGTKSAQYRWHSSVWHQQCFLLWCDISNSGVQLLLAEGLKVITVHAMGEAGFFSYFPVYLQIQLQADGCHDKL
jgi:hypothetical protein